MVLAWFDFTDKILWQFTINRQRVTDALNLWISVTINFLLVSANFGSWDTPGADGSYDGSLHMRYIIPHNLISELLEIVGNVAYHLYNEKITNWVLKGAILCKVQEVLIEEIVHKTLNFKLIAGGDFCTN